MLCLHRSVEAYDEVVAGMVSRAVEGPGLGQEEDAPVRDAAHDPAALEDGFTGGFAYSRQRMSVMKRGPGIKLDARRRASRVGRTL